MRLGIPSTIFVLGLGRLYLAEVAASVGHRQGGNPEECDDALRAGSEGGCGATLSLSLPGSCINHAGNVHYLSLIFDSRFLNLKQIQVTTGPENVFGTAVSL